MTRGPPIETLTSARLLTSALTCETCAGLGAGGLGGALAGVSDLAGGLTYGPPPSNAASDLGLGLTYGPPPVGSGMGGMAPLSGVAGGGGLGGSGLDYGPRPPMQTGVWRHRQRAYVMLETSCAIATASSCDVQLLTMQLWSV